MNRSNCQRLQPWTAIRSDLARCVTSGALMLLAGCTTQPRALMPTASGGDGFFPLGVYWPGEYTYPDAASPAERWVRIERMLDQLERDGVNTIWLTHLSAVETARFARLAARRGLRMVAACAEIAGNVPGIRRGDGAAIRDKALADWGDGPAPLAWGLGDEPRTPYMAEMVDYVAAWHAAGLPTTTVLMPGDVAAGSALLPLTFLCSDGYPFFSAGNPNGPNNLAASLMYFMAATQRTCEWAEKRGQLPWIMAQGFQEPWGAFDFDAAGNVIYQPGGGPHWRMPSPAEVRWQCWAALAGGARGLFFFSLHLGMSRPATVIPLPEGAPIAVPAVTNCGLPAGLVYLDGRPTPQYEAMAASYRKIGALREFLAGAQSAGERFAFLAKGSPGVGTLAACFLDRNGQALVVVVNGNMDALEDIAVNLEPGYTSARDLVTGKAVPLFDREVKAGDPVGPFRQMRIQLQPGDGTVVALRR